VNRITAVSSPVVDSGGFLPRFAKTSCGIFFFLFGVMVGRRKYRSRGAEIPLRPHGIFAIANQGGKAEEKTVLRVMSLTAAPVWPAIPLCPDSSPSTSRRVHRPTAASARLPQPLDAGGAPPIDSKYKDFGNGFVRDFMSPFAPRL
jgi:hypothetical protein